MRIWDLPVSRLCRQHLLGEHRELHVIWNIVSGARDGGGYRHHPETKRWVGHALALSHRHDAQVAEMTKRGYKHQSPLNGQVTGSNEWPNGWQTVSEQLERLRDKQCNCQLERSES